MACRGGQALAGAIEERLLDGLTPRELADSVKSLSIQVATIIQLWHVPLLMIPFCAVAAECHPRG